MTEKALFFISLPYILTHRTELPMTLYVCLSSPIIHIKLVNDTSSHRLAIQMCLPLS